MDLLTPTADVDVAPVTSHSGLRLPTTILGTGVGVPRRIVTNAELVADLDTTDEWIRARTGIRERRFLEAGRSTSELCVEAARQALHAAGVAAADLDAVILATITPDQPLPSTALLVKEAIGAHRAIPFDLNQAACAGGVLGLILGANLLQNDGFRTVLVIGADAMSRLTDPGDRTTRVFFGDAAGAVVLGRGAEGYGVLSWDAGSLLSHSVEIPAGGAGRPASAESVAAGDHYLKMDGRVVWDEATDKLPKSIARVLELAGLTVDDVAHFAVHQANRNIIDEVMRRLGADRERAGITLDWLGNTGGATIFTVLHGAVTNRKVQPGDVVVIAGIGAGFIWGTLCFRYS